MIVAAGAVNPVSAIWTSTNDVLLVTLSSMILIQLYALINAAAFSTGAGHPCLCILLTVRSCRLVSVFNGHTVLA